MVKSANASPSLVDTQAKTKKQVKRQDNEGEKPAKVKNDNTNNSKIEKKDV